MKALHMRGFRCLGCQMRRRSGWARGLSLTSSVAFSLPVGWKLGQDDEDVRRDDDLARDAPQRRLPVRQRSAPDRPARRHL